MTWLYKQTERGSDYSLFTVGYYEPDGTWQPESDWSDREKAAKRTSYLNGGSPDSP